MKPVLARLLLVIASVAASPASAVELAQATRPREAGIASANHQASAAGREILAAGGNAFDAAVAVSATLGLVEPESSGLGGGGFFLLHVAAGDGQPARDVFVDARERAPAAATRDMYLDANGNPVPERSTDGALAAAIPGLPAALVHLAEHYGRLPLARSLAPAIRLAREGWEFGPKNAAMLGTRRAVLERSPAAKALFLPEGRVPAVGTRIRNPDYARTLELLAAQGADGFYRGDYARRLADGVRAAGGIWTAQDLADYRVVERDPLRLRHRGYELVTAPPPSSGGIALAEILNVLAGYALEDMDQTQRVHLNVEAMRRAYRDRAIYLGDPDHVEVPTALLMDPAYAAGLRAGIRPDRATPSAMLPGIGAPSERPETTHYSIVDADGNMAAVTQTVNLIFGSALAIEGTGFMLNNEMDDFSAKPGVPNAFGLVGAEANAVGPGKRPLSSMTPTFLIGPDRAAAIGTPGGSRIITMVLLGLQTLMDGGDAQAAAARPRYHHQYLPDAISAEPDAFDARQVEALEAMGHTVSAGERTWGNMQVVTWDLDSGEVEVGNDPRWESASRGNEEADRPEQKGSIYR
ncbi:gamma-glutamyltransferase [Coralloluteibacterium stylophorae]|uniref:Glutathione hydrolase proenzyme n=1 Tax=Coralloluteibacterium stylophorae TaxID=1776034 RepID=A0A8J7VSU4_9GAMM|nr:gamma-glutamyltransferase [Coralloluteibacterium stylophorae]MBS7456176.1 gamma-glutamyltransferase [Coralloluteibacterium stylophorae]